MEESHFMSMWVFRIMRTQTGIGACIIAEEKERRRATVKMQLYVL